MSSDRTRAAARRQALQTLSALSALAVALAACGGSDDPAVAAAPAPAPVAAPVPAPAPVVTGQRLVLDFSAATADYNGSVAAIDLAQTASNAAPGSTSFVTPSYSISVPPRQVQFTFASPGGSGTVPVTPGSYAVGASTGLWATVFYNEAPGYGWEGTAGTLIVDAVAGDVVQYRFVDVRLVASRRFGSTASVGGFTCNGAGNARQSCVSPVTCQ